MQRSRPQKRIRLSVGNKFTLLLSSALLLCALFLCIISALLFSRQMREKARMSGSELLGNASDRLTTYMDGIDKMAYSLMFNKTTQNVLGEINRGSVNSYLKYTNQNNLYYTLLLQATINSDIEIAIFPLEANQVGFASDNLGWGKYEYSREDWFITFENDPGLRKQYLINRTTAYRTAAFQEPAHIVAYRVNSVYSTKAIGYMCVYIYPRAIETILGNISENIKNLALVDENDAVVFYTDETADVQSLLEMETMQKRGRLFPIVDRGLFISEPIDNTPWRILCIYDMTSSERDTEKILLTIFLTAAACCFLCIPLIWRFVLRMLKPVEQLTIGMEWVKMGKLDFTLETSRQDELGQAINNFNEMTRELDEARRNLNTMAILQRDMGISALRQQINPHFLYNTLDMIIGMTTEGNQRAIIEVCKALGGMFRYNLNGDHMVMLKSELEQTRRYVQISKYRFLDRFEMTYNVDQNLLDQRIPKLILQPLIENSVLHGFSGISRKGEIHLAITPYDSSQFSIIVKDTGSGMPQAMLQALRDSLPATASLVEGKSHIGIRNVYARLKLEYGNDISMDIESRIDVGTQITILLPMRK